MRQLVLHFPDSEGSHGAGIILAIASIGILSSSIGSSTTGCRIASLRLFVLLGYVGRFRCLGGLQTKKNTNISFFKLGVGGF